MVHVAPPEAVLRVLPRVIFSRHIHFIHTFDLSSLPPPLPPYHSLQRCARILYTSLLPSLLGRGPLHAFKRASPAATADAAATNHSASLSLGSKHWLTRKAATSKRLSALARAPTAAFSQRSVSCSSAVASQVNPLIAALESHRCDLTPFPCFISFAELQRNQARLAIKIEYLNAAANGIRLSSPSLHFNRSDAITIQIACAQAGSLSIKIHKNVGTCAWEAVMRETERLCDCIARDTQALLHMAHAQSVFYRFELGFLHYRSSLLDSCFYRGSTANFLRINVAIGSKMTQFGGWELLLYQKNPDAKQVLHACCFLSHSLHRSSCATC